MSSRIQKIDVPEDERRAIFAYLKRQDPGSKVCTIPVLFYNPTLLIIRYFEPFTRNDEPLRRILTGHVSATPQQNILTLHPNPLNTH